MSRATGVAYSKNCVHPIFAFQRGTTTTRHPLVTRGNRISGVATPRSLHQISSHGRHIADLGRSAFKQSLGNDRILLYYTRIFRHISHFLECSNVKPSAVECYSAKGQGT